MITDHAVLANEIAEAIYADADDRSGMLDDIDGETLDEIKETWRGIIKRILLGAK